MVDYRRLERRLSDLEPLQGSLRVDTCLMPDWLLGLILGLPSTDDASDEQDAFAADLPEGITPSALGDLLDEALHAFQRGTLSEDIEHPLEPVWETYSTNLRARLEREQDREGP